MDDKERLKLAGQAANYPELDGFSLNPLLGMRWVDDDRMFVRYWNPLVSNKDAFRLMVDLSISVEFDEDSVSAKIYQDGSVVSSVLEPVEDRYSAVRRAIVRAAATKYMLQKKYNADYFYDHEELMAI